MSRVEFKIAGVAPPLESHSLLYAQSYAMLDEFLFRFSTDDCVVCCEAKVLSIDRDTWTLKVRGKGESWDPKKHPQGTEIKAITYSNMQIHEDKSTNDVYVILDI